MKKLMILCTCLFMTHLSMAQTIVKVANFTTCDMVFTMEFFEPPNYVTCTTSAGTNPVYIAAGQTLLLSVADFNDPLLLASSHPLLVSQ